MVGREMMAVSLGLFAVGGIALGYVAVDGLAAGGYAIGGCADAARVAMGGVAQTPVSFATGNVGFRTGDLNAAYPDLTPEKVQAIILDKYSDTWKWVASLMSGLFR